MNRKLLQLKIFPPLLVLFLSVGLAEFLTRHGIIRNFILPAPSEVLRAFFQERSTLWDGALSTFTSATIGLGLSFFLGFLGAVLLSMSSFLRRAIYPYAIFFQTVPVIAIAPLLVIWFGFGQSTVVACSFIVSVFPIIANTLLGLESTDPQLLDLFHLYSASKKDYLLKLRLPFALPQIFSGLRISAGLSIVGTIVGEFIAGGGLGGVVDAARTQQRLDLVFAAVMASSFLGLIFIALINYLSWAMLHKWHASEQRI
jgi:NitT/TauT family transport system permease protein